MTTTITSPDGTGVRLIRAGLRTLAAHEADAAARSRSQDIPGTGIACPACGGELAYRKAGAALLVDPPRHHLRCPGCGWAGTAAY